MVDSHSLEEKAFWNLLKSLEFRDEAWCKDHFKKEHQVKEQFWDKLWKVLSGLGYQEEEAPDGIGQLVKSPDAPPELTSHSSIAEWLSLQFYFYKTERSWCSPNVHPLCLMIGDVLEDEELCILVQRQTMEQGAA